MKFSFKKSLYILIFIAFLGLSWKSFQSHIFNIHFVDEDENIIAGYYMNRGEKLYSDIFSHKQPLPAIMSMTAQKITKPENLYMLIKRQRETVFFYSAFWSSILILEFGLPALIFSVFFEIAKTFLLGNLFLGESLAVFPAVYILGYLWKYYKDFEKVSKLSKYVFSSSIILIVLSLFALIPLALIGILPVFLTKKKKSYLFPLLLSALVALVLTIPFVNYPKYFENTMAALQTHYLGTVTDEGGGKILLYSFLRPITDLFVARIGDFGNFIWSLSGVYLISFIYLFLKKSLKKALLFSFFLVGISSLRYIEPSATLYNGFHALPWFGLILWLTILQLSSIKEKKIFSPANLLLFLFTMLLLYQAKFFFVDYYRQTDKERDWYVNFSRFNDWGETIRKQSAPGDKLLVLPVEQLIYWRAGLPHATRFLYGYEWLFVNNNYRQEISHSLETDKPAFIYYDRESMGNDARSIFDKYVASYVRYKQEGIDTILFIRPR